MRPPEPGGGRARLERTGRVITAAALLFCVAVGAFTTSGIVIVKEVGIGIARRRRDRRHARPGAPRAEPDGAARRLELVAPGPLRRFRR